MYPIVLRHIWKLLVSIKMDNVPDSEDEWTHHMAEFSWRGPFDKNGLIRYAAENNNWLDTFNSDAFSKSCLRRQKHDATWSMTNILQQTATLVNNARPGTSTRYMSNQKWHLPCGNRVSSLLLTDSLGRSFRYKKNIRNNVAVAAYGGCDMYGMAKLISTGATTPAERSRYFNFKRADPPTAFPANTFICR